ncbi:MAG: transcriptional regulator [Desulfovibrionaceae bacterium CG1_02_65_16]|nr:MAG: transcriptional regulator [Desulfovibrionaceae bacterium CG1_02_65_16]
MADACAAKELNGKKYRCFFELALSVMGGKWKPIILYHLGQSGVLRFSEMRRGMPEVTDRMLTRQLRELEADGLITRTVYRQVPPRVEYALTEPGLGLFPILVTMRDWGAGYEKAMGAAPTPAGEAYEVDRKPSLHPRYRKGADQPTPLAE